MHKTHLFAITIALLTNQRDTTSLLLEELVFITCRFPGISHHWLAALDAGAAPPFFFWDFA